MNVYDFDGTIYHGDCTIDFYLWNLKRNPKLLRFLPIQMEGALNYIFKRINKAQFKESFFSFLKGINCEYAIPLFWDRYECKIETWYLNQKRRDDQVISASPEFLLSEICRRLDIERPIGSIINHQTGTINGKNCKGMEKVDRFLQKYSLESIDSFYSDSLSDTPLASYSKYAFLVKHGKLQPWPQCSNSKKEF